MIAPADEAGIVEAISAAHASRTPLRIEGRGTKSAMLRPVQAAETLSTRNLRGIALYAPNELIVSVRAGTPVPELEAMLAASGQHLIAEPPDLSGLMGADAGRVTEAGSAATIGGVVAANLSGPRRVAWGATRDHVMGVRVVNGAGEALRFGGRVLKNVTGLDLCKLLTGSHGTLGVLTEVTLKVLPAPESSGTLVLRGQDAAAAVRTLSAALGSPFGVSGAAWLPAPAAACVAELAGGSATLIRIEEFPPSVAYRLERLRAELGGDMLGEADSRAVWQAVRDAVPLSARADDAVWRVSVRPSLGPGVIASVPEATHFLDWGGGLVWLAGSPGLHAAVMRAARAAGGVWTVLRGPEPMRAAVDVVPPEPPALARLTRRVKDALDPHGILNPGRLFAGV